MCSTDQGNRKFGEKFSRDPSELPQDKQIFLTYQKELDERHDRHERIVKCSRDITIESKKIIFLLHRYTTQRNDNERSNLLRTAEKRLADVRSNQMQRVAKEMACISDQFMHNRAITFGIQEHIEASAFYEFIASGQLLTFDDLQAKLTFVERDEEGNEKKFVVEVTPSDYILGLSDVGGELMRYAMNQVTAGRLDIPAQIVKFMRMLYEGYLLQNPNIQHRDFGQKLTVFRQSLMKVENVLYTDKLKQTELPDEFQKERRPPLVSCID